MDLKKFIKNQKGASELIETVMMLQVVIMLVFGMIYFIHAAGDDVIMESAARSGARVFGITGSESDAIAKAQEELDLGGVRADVDIDNNIIVITKSKRIKVPFLSEFNFGLKKESLFYREEESFYYDKEPHLQRSPIDGYSGYTGNPYR